MEENKEIFDEAVEEVNEAENNAEVAEEEVTEESENNEVNEESNNEEVTDDLAAMRKLKDENKKLGNELEALKDRLLRLTAEYDNYRKRTAKEKEGIYTDACTDVLKEIIPAIDTLERAVAVEGSVEDFKKGIEMTLKGFKGSLEKLGVEEIDTENGFDPNLHQAIMHEDNPELGTNVIAEVFMKGYKKGDKVIRYSMVKVAN